MTEYPKLMWLPDGREITVRSKDEEDQRLSDGCSLKADRSDVAARAAVAAAYDALPDVETEPEPDDEPADEPKKKAKK